MPKTVLNQVLDELIEESFPDLKPVPIDISYRKNGSFWLNEEGVFLTVEPRPNNSYTIWVDTPLKSATREQKKGGIAHELGHVFLDVKGNLFTIAAYADRAESPVKNEFNLQYERSTDFIAVRRGCLVELIEFILFLNKAGYVVGKEEGLKLAELYPLLLRPAMKYDKSKYMNMNSWFCMYQRYRKEHGLLPSGSR